MATVLLLVIILKPFSKAVQRLSGTDYVYYNQTSDSNGYAVDYGGVIDMVTYSKPGQVEIVVHQSANYIFTFSVKENSRNSKNVPVSILKNNQKVDSLTLAVESQKAKIHLRKNDYFKVKLHGSGLDHTEIEIKMQKRTTARQLGVYVICVLWILLGLYYLRQVSFWNFITPSLAFLLAVYSEHLYAVKDWFVPMVGFVLVTYSLILVRHQLQRLKLGFVKGIFVLIYDYALIAFSIGISGFVWHYKFYGYRLDFDSLVAVFQSNWTETWEFLWSMLPIWMWLPVLALILLPVFLLYFSRNNTGKPLSSKVVFLTFGLIGIGLSSKSQFIGEFIRAYSQYYEEIAKFNEVQSAFHKQSNLVAEKNEKGETYVIVIGESQAKEHMSLYGYYKKTTPVLDKLYKNGDLAVLRNAYSSHTHTVMVLRDALTLSNQYNGLDYTQVPTLMNVLKAAKVKTVWLSNQVKLSNWDNMVSAIATGCDKQIYTNKQIGETVSGSPYDEVLLPELQKELTNGKKGENKVIFVHLMGNHGKYSERYPENFTKLKSRGKADYGLVDDLEMWESYDNSIKYNDSIVGEIIELVNSSNTHPSSICYFADHGEDLRQNRGHNVGMFTYRMTQIPMFVWSNEAWKSKYSAKNAAMYGVKDKLFSNELFFQFALDWMNVETPFRNVKLDLLSDSFNLVNPRVREGRIAYDTNANPYVSIKKNLAFITKSGTNRIGAHRVDSYGKLSDVENAGMQFIEMDVKLDTKNNRIEVGHGEDHVMSGQSLTKFLSEMDTTIKKVWLDVKNLNESNVALFNVKFTEARRVLNRKVDFIVETSSSKPFVANISNPDYQVSFYIHSEEFLGKSEEEKRRKFGEIARRVSMQKLNSVSFDAVMYEDVVRYLYPQLPSKITVHLWDTNIEMHQSGLEESLQNKVWWNDSRVQSILLSFDSPYNL